MKKVFALYRTGIFVLVPIFVIAAVIGWLWEAAYAVSFGNMWVTLGLLLFGPLLFGWGISTRWFRGFLLGVCSQIPVVSTLTQILFNHEFVERLKSGQMPGVLVPVSGGGWSPGVAVRTYELPENIREQKGKKVNWVLVLAPATAPVVFTAQLRLYRESEVVYLANTITDMALGFASLGLNLKLDQAEFRTVFDLQPKTENKNPPE